MTASTSCADKTRMLDISLRQSGRQSGRRRTVAAAPPFVASRRVSRSLSALRSPLLPHSSSSLYRLTPVQGQTTRLPRTMCGPLPSLPLTSPPPPASRARRPPARCLRGRTDPAADTVYAQVFFPVIDGHRRAIQQQQPKPLATTRSSRRRVSTPVHQPATATAALPTTATVPAATVGGTGLFERAAAPERQRLRPATDARAATDGTPVPLPALCQGSARQGKLQDDRRPPKVYARRPRFAAEHTTIHHGSLANRSHVLAGPHADVDVNEWVAVNRESARTGFRVLPLASNPPQSRTGTPRLANSAVAGAAARRPSGRPLQQPELVLLGRDRVLHR